MSATLNDYLESLQGATLKKLYRQPSTVLAVLRRMLPHLAKNIAMAMLYMPQPFPESDLRTWIRTDHPKERDEALDVLQRLSILEVDPERPTPKAYRLDPAFAQSLRQALAGAGNHNSFGVPYSKADPQRLTVQDLDRWARTKWEGILFYVVDAAHTKSSHAGAINPGTKALLNFGGFVQGRADHSVITKEGFSFVLQDTNTQVWQLLLVYLEKTPALGMDSVQVLSFLFMLGSLTLGQDYSTAPLTETQKSMLDDLSDLGLVYKHPDDRSRYYPTRLATTLTSDSSALVEAPASASSMADLSGGEATGKGYIILETNHRLYAYTNSELQIKILGHFTKLHSRFPNLVSGILTKNSINRAIREGITSDQVIAYLTTHAHPQMLRNNPILPPTVVDQIRLWQLEEDRMKSTSGFLLQEFASFSAYKEAVDYAEQLGVVVWRRDHDMKFFVNDIRQLQAFLKQQSSRAKG